jgi:hypothetical protein
VLCLAPLSLSHSAPCCSAFALSLSLSLSLSSPNFLARFNGVESFQSTGLSLECGMRRIAGRSQAWPGCSARYLSNKRSTEKEERTHPKVVGQRHCMGSTAPRWRPRACKARSGGIVGKFRGRCSCLRHFQGYSLLTTTSGAH